jgi:hypothetical protein
MSRSRVGEFRNLPSAVVTDGLLVVPLFAVSRIFLSERYSLPPVGSSSFRAAVPTSDDSVSLDALLVGPQRFAWKTGLELLADFSRRGGSLGRWTGGVLGGVILVTSMTVRTDMQFTDLTFTASAQRRETLEVSMSLRHVPRPSPLNTLLDIGAAGVMTAVEFLV